MYTYGSYTIALKLTAFYQVGSGNFLLVVPCAVMRHIGVALL